MSRAGQQCQCTGTCGNRHTKTGGRCGVLAGGREDVLLAPADLLLSDVARARVPVRELLLWCASCHRQTATAQRKAQQTAPAETSATTLF